MPTSGIARHGLSPAGLAARAGRTPHLRRRCGPSSGTLRPPGGGPAGPRRASPGRIGSALAVHTDPVWLKFLPLCHPRSPAPQRAVCRPGIPYGPVCVPRRV